MCDRALQSVVEAIGECVAFEDVGEARVSEDVIVIGDGGECPQRFGVGVDDVGAIDSQDGDPRALGVWCDGGEREIARGMIECERAPASGWCIACDCGAQSAHDFARVGGRGESGVWCECGGEQPERAVSAGDVSAGDQLVDADGT